jgi:outer membrane protein assembly factor BamB
VTDDTGFAAPTVTTDGKAVYAIFSNGDIICFDYNGNRKWAKNLGVPDNHYGHSSSLLLYKTILIVQYDHNRARNLIGLNTQNGDISWNTGRPGHISWSSPILINDGSRDQVIVNNEPYVAGYDPLTGKELWKMECLSGEIGPSPAFANGLVFAVNAYAKLAAIKPGSSPKIVWENEDFLPDVSSPVAWKDFLIVTTSAGEVACYNTKDGTLFWKQEFDIGFYASPVIADGKIYLMNRDGKMHIMKADKNYSLIAEPMLNEKSDCTPAFAKGRIYLRGKKNLYCIGTR